MPRAEDSAPARKPVTPAKAISLGAKVGKAVSRGARRVSSSGSSRGSSSSGSRSGSGYSPKRTGGGGGGGNRGNTGGGGYKPPKAPKPAVPNINSYLGTDATYQGIVSGSKRSLADFLSELGRRRGESTTQFNDTLGSMERDRTRQLDDIRQEFASRGLIQSGLFGEEQGRFQQQFTEQRSALEKQQAALLADLLSQETNYKREQELALEAARQDALARRAAKFNIGG
jgi:hypothetical protein